MNRKTCSFLVALLLTVASCGRSGTEAGSDHEADSHQAEAGPHAEETGILELDPEALAQAGIRTSRVEAALVFEQVAATAVVAPNESRLGHLRPLSEGVVRQVFVQRGDRVRQKQPLLSYDNVELGELVGLYRRQQAELRRSEARRDVNEKSLERAQKLFDIQAISRKELELRDADLIGAEEEMQRWQAAIAQTAVKLRRFGVDAEQLGVAASEGELPPDHTLTVLQAPFDGVVIDYDTSPGEVVSPQQVLMTVADLSLVWVLADVFERDLGKIIDAEQATVEVEAYPGRVFEGRLTYFGDVVDPHTRTVKVRAVVANPGHLLKLGMFATVRISTGEGRRFPVVPADAVQLIEGRAAVFVGNGEGRFERRWIEAGRENEGWVPVTAGLETGELVVTEGSFSLKSELLRDELGGGHGH